MRILGIDPGTRVVGFACIDNGVAMQSARLRTPRDFRVLDAGVLRTEATSSLPDRLGALHETLYELADRWRPTVCVIEKAFYGANVASALKLGEARGALVSALRRCSIPVCEITPAEVKRMIAGNGAADKEQVSRAIELLLGFKRGKLPYDVTDALAIALTHGFRGHQSISRPKREADFERI